MIVVDFAEMCEAFNRAREARSAARARLAPLASLRGCESDPRVEWLRSSVHESGHGVCAAELGCTSIALSLRPPELMARGTCTYVVGPSWSPRKAAVVAVSGILAVRLAGGDGLDGAGADSFSVLGLPGPELAAVLGEAGAILLKRWPSVIALSEALRSKGTLDAQAVEEILGAQS